MQHQKSLMQGYKPVKKRDKKKFKIWKNNGPKNLKSKTTNPKK